jgi:hypothetical protein
MAAGCAGQSPILGMADIAMDPEPVFLGAWEFGELPQLG